MLGSASNDTAAEAGPDLSFKAAASAEALPMHSMAPQIAVPTSAAKTPRLANIFFMLFLLYRSIVTVT